MGGQGGFSLLELLIATSIGLVITVGAIAVFTNSTMASRTTEAQSRMNEDAQAALGLLSREIKMAGNNPIATVVNGLATRNPISALTLHGCSGLFFVDANSVNDHKLRCDISASSMPHSLFVRYEADPWNTAASTPADCLGYKLTPPTGSPNIAENRYYIGTSPVIRAPSLYCKGNGGAGLAQPLVENIEDLKFSFGVTTPAASTPASAPPSDPPVGHIAGYLSATNVEKLALSPSREDIAKAWRQVLTVQICIVVRSDSKNLTSDNASSTYTQCDGTQDTSQTDRRLRRAYTTTVALRNRLN